MPKDVKTADFLNLPANSKQLKKKINKEIPRTIRTTVLSPTGIVFWQKYYRVI